MSKKAWDAGCWDDEGALVLLSLPGVEVQEGGMIWAKKMTMAAPLPTQAHTGSGSGTGTSTAH
jgi:hypothetical protein